MVSILEWLELHVGTISTVRLIQRTAFVTSYNVFKMTVQAQRLKSLEPCLTQRSLYQPSTSLNNNFANFHHPFLQECRTLVGNGASPVQERFRFGRLGPPPDGSRRLTPTSGLFIVLIENSTLTISPCSSCLVSFSTSRELSSSRNVKGSRNVKVMSSSNWRRRERKKCSDLFRFRKPQG
jgi:hypothetical protein